MLPALLSLPHRPQTPATPTFPTATDADGIIVCSTNRKQNLCSLLFVFVHIFNTHKMVIFFTTIFSFVALGHPLLSWPQFAVKLYRPANPASCGRLMLEFCWLFVPQVRNGQERFALINRCSFVFSKSSQRCWPTQTNKSNVRDKN